MHMCDTQSHVSVVEVGLMNAIVDREIYHYVHC